MDYEFLRSYNLTMDQEEPKESRLFGRVWPDGIPDRDLVIWKGLLPEARAPVLGRLEAVWRAERGEPWAPLAEGIGLGRSAFFNLRKLWREFGLEGIVPFARQSPRRVEAAADSPVRALARTVVKEHDLRARNVDLARILLSRAVPGTFGGGVEQSRLQAAERMVRHERRALAADPTWLRRNWGLRLLIDVTAVSVVISGEGELAVAAMCVDVASGLILGSTLGRLSTVVETERSAVDEAWRFVRTRRADRDPAAWPPCGLDLMLPSEDDDGSSRREVARVVGDLDIRLPGSYSFGSELVQIIGPRVGRVPLAPRRTLAIAAEGFARSRQVVELERSDANRYWTREVMRHNEAIIDALERSGTWDDRCVDGRLAAAFHAIDGLLLSLPEYRRSED